VDTHIGRGCSGPVQVRRARAWRPCAALEQPSSCLRRGASEERFFLVGKKEVREGRDNVGPTGTRSGAASGGSERCSPGGTSAFSFKVS
jgi:hypothetical protein